MRDRLIEIIAKSNLVLVDGGIHPDTHLTQEALADHLLAAGVIVPPCKVGDTVYVVQMREIYECRVNDICISAGNNNVVVLDRFINGFLIRRYRAEYFNAFGKTVFLTKEEAERALAERREG